MCGAPSRRWRARRPALARDVGEREPDRAQQTVGIGEVREQIRGVRAAAVADRGHGDRAPRRVAREHVAAARAAACEQAVTVRAAPLDLGRVTRMVGDQCAPGLLLVPAERRHVPVAAEQQAGLAGARLAREVALPADQLVAARFEPPRDRRRVAVLERRAQHLLAEAVDLEQDHPRHIGAVPGARVARAPPDHPHVARVAVEVEQRDERSGDERQHGRDQEVGPECRRAARRPQERERHDPGAHRERGQTEGDQRQRQRKPDHGGPDERVDQRDREHDQKRFVERDPLDAAEHVGEADEDEGLDCDQYEPADQQAREIAGADAHPGATARHGAWRRWLAWAR